MEISREEAQAAVRWLVTPTEEGGAGWSRPKVAAEVGVSERTVYRWLDDGDIQSQIIRRVLIETAKNQGWDGKFEAVPDAIAPATTEPT